MAGFAVAGPGGLSRGIPVASRSVVLPRARLAGRYGAWPECSALALIASAHAAVALWSPLLVTPDGLDYLQGAFTLAHGGGFGDVVPYKAPGLTVLLAGLMWVTHAYFPLLHGLQALLGLVTVVMAWGLLRPIGRWRALAGAVAVGLHPVLLMYEGYLLRESLAAFLLTLIGWLLLRGRREQGAGWAGWKWTIATGAACGALALLRENGPVTVGVVAVLSGLLCPYPYPRRVWMGVARGCCVLSVAVAVLLPWGWHLHTTHGVIGVTVPKLQFNRVVNAWWAGLLDGTELNGLGRGKSDYAYVARALVLTHAGGPGGEATPADTVVWWMTNQPRELEDLCKELIDTASARRPAKLWACRADAIAGLMGVWSVKNPAARTDAFNARALMGESRWTTNYLFDVEGLLTLSRFKDREQPLRAVLADTRAPLRTLPDSGRAGLVRGWWRVFEVLRFVFGWGFLLGVAAAAIRREWVMAAIGAVVLLNLGGAAWVALTPIDRFAAPFIPLMVVVAAFGAGEVLAWRPRGRRAMGASDRLQPGVDRAAEGPPMIG